MFCKICGKQEVNSTSGICDKCINNQIKTYTLQEIISAWEQKDSVNGVRATTMSCEAAFSEFIKTLIK